MKMEKKVYQSLEEHAYAIYDSQLGTYEPTMIFKPNDCDDFITRLVNDVSSKYYNHEDCYTLYDLGLFSPENGRIVYYPESVYLYRLDIKIDQRKRDIQECIRTLNFVPNGFHKINDEMREEIQSKIDKQVDFYVRNFCDVSNSLQDTLTPTNN